MPRRRTRRRRRRHRRRRRRSRPRRRRLCQTTSCAQEAPATDTRRFAPTLFSLGGHAAGGLGVRVRIADLEPRDRLRSRDPGAGARLPPRVLHPLHPLSRHAIQTGGRPRSGSRGKLCRRGDAPEAPEAARRSGRWVSSPTAAARPTRDSVRRRSSRACATVRASGAPTATMRSTPFAPCRSATCTTRVSRGSCIACSRET